MFSDVFDLILDTVIGFFTALLSASLVELLTGALGFGEETA